MAQHDYIIDNQPGASFRADLNAALAAIVSNNSGATAPATPYPFQWWADTTAGVLKQRDASNSEWRDVYPLGRELVSQTGSTGAAILPEGSEAQRPVPGGTGLYVRLNAEAGKPEWYNRLLSAWKKLVDEDQFGVLDAEVQNLPRRSYGNKIINGKMEIAQRGVSFASPNGAYTLDRWRPSIAGTAAFTVAQSSDAPANSAFRYSLRLSVTTADAAIAATDRCAITQFIEGYNAAQLLGQAFTLSFWVRSAKTGIHCVSFGNEVDRCYLAEYTINAANTWEYKTITVQSGLPSAGTWNYTSGIGLGVNFTLVAGSSFQGAKDTWLSSTMLGTADQVNCLDTVGNIFAITGVQLEVGEVATPFEHRPYGVELALCQRYYWQDSTTALQFGSLTGANSTNRNGRIYLPVSMRVAPTVSVTTNLGTGIAEYITVNSFGWVSSVGDSTSSRFVTSADASAEL